MKRIIKIAIITTFIGMMFFVFAYLPIKSDFFGHGISIISINSKTLYGIDSTKEQLKYNVLIEVSRFSPFGLQYSLGSGVIISETGEILTAKHVIQDAFEIRITLFDGRVFDINEPKDFYVDEKTDVGFIDLHTTNLEFTEISDCNEITEDAKVYSIGNPVGLFVSREFEGKIVDADFKRVFLGKAERHLLIGMQVFHGCSGGAIYLKDTNQLIGINSRVFENYTIAVSSESILSAFERFHNSK